MLKGPWSGRRSRPINSIEANKKPRAAQEAATENEEIVRQNILDRAKKAGKKKEGEEDEIDEV